jgi:hypothetical protein
MFFAVGYQVANVSVKNVFKEHCRKVGNWKVKYLSMSVDQ